MSSQKKSSTKVRAKNAAPTGQRQRSNLSRSKTALVKAPSRSRKSGAFVSSSVDQVSRGNTKITMRTGFKSELFASLDVTSSAEFVVKNRIRLNPLSKATFKWLPTIAQNFESFKFHKLSFRYENRCSALTSGSVIMSPSYDAADSNAQAATEALLYQNKGTVDFSVWKNGALHLNCAAMNRLYKSHTCMSDERYAVTTQDQKTIDAGQVFICLDGVPSNTFTGKVFVDYDVEFFDPHSPTEPVNQGGEVIVTNGPVTNTGTPFTSLPSLILAESSPIMKSLSQMVLENSQPNPSVSPTSIIGQFLKDYSGLIDIDMDGVGIVSTNQAMGLTIDPRRAFAPTIQTAVDYIIGTNPIINNTSTQMRSLFRVVAKAGEFLKYQTPIATSINGFTARLAGTNVV